MSNPFANMPKDLVVLTLYYLRDDPDLVQHGIAFITGFEIGTMEFKCARAHLMWQRPRIEALVKNRWRREFAAAAQAAQAATAAEQGRLACYLEFGAGAGSSSDNPIVF